MYDSSSSDDEICFGPLTLEECKKYLRAPLNLPSKITLRKPQAVDRQKENCLALANLSIDNVSKHNNSLKILSNDAKSKTNDTGNLETIEISSDEEACVEIFDQNEEGTIKKNCSPNAEDVKVLNDTLAKNDTSSFRSSICNFTADSLDVHMGSKNTNFSKDSLQTSTQSTDVEESLKVVYFKQSNYEQKKLETSATENKTNSSVTDDSRLTVNSVFSDIQKENKELNLKGMFETSVTLSEDKRNKSKIDDSLVENVLVDDVLKTNDGETVEEILLRKSNFANDASDSKGNNDESKNTQEIILENVDVNTRAEENAQSENSVLITAGKLIDECYENIYSDVLDFTSCLKILPEIESTSENVSANVSSHLFSENVLENSGNASRSPPENTFVEKVPEKSITNFDLRNISANDSSRLFSENVLENSGNASRSPPENIFVEKVPEKSITNFDLRNISANDSSRLFLENVFDNSGNASITEKCIDSSYKHNIKNSLSEPENISLNPLLENVSSMDSLDILSPSTLNNTTFSQPHEAFNLKTKQIRKAAELSDITEMPSTSKSETSSLIHLLSDLENSGKSSDSQFSERKDEKMVSNDEKISDRNSFEASNSSSQKITSNESENCSQDYRLSCSKDRSFDTISASNATYDANSYSDHENDNDLSTDESIRFDGVFENFQEASESIYTGKVPEKNTTNIEFKNICSKHPSRLFFNVCESSENASKSMSEDIFLEKNPERSGANIEFKNISAIQSSGLFLENVFENCGNASKSMSEKEFVEKIPERSFTDIETKNISAKNSSRLFLEDVFENFGNASKSMSEKEFVEKIPERSFTDIETKNISAKNSSRLFLEDVFENFGNASKSMSEKEFVKKIPERSFPDIETKNISANNSSRLFLEDVFENCGNASKSMSEKKFVEKTPERSPNIETLKLARLESVDACEIIPGNGFDFTNSVRDANIKMTEYCSEKNDDSEISNNLSLSKNVSVETIPKVRNVDKRLNLDIYSKELKLPNDFESSKTPESRSVEKRVDILNKFKNSSGSSWETVSDVNSTINQEKPESKSSHEHTRRSENLNISIDDSQSIKSTWKTFSNENRNYPEWKEKEHRASFENFKQKNESSISVSSENVPSSNERKRSNLFHYDDSFKFSDSYESRRTSDFNTSGELNDTMEEVERLLRMHSELKQTGVNPAQSESSKRPNTIVNAPLRDEPKQNTLSVNKTSFDQKQNAFGTNKTPVQANRNSTVKNKTPLQGLANKSPLFVFKNKTPAQSKMNAKTPISVGKQTAVAKTPLMEDIVQNTPDVKQGLANKSPLFVTKNKTPAQNKINAKTPISVGKQTAVAKTPLLEDIVQNTPDVKQATAYNRYKIGVPRTGATKIASHNNKPIDSNPQNIKKVSAALKKSEVPVKGTESNFRSLLKKPQVYGSHSEVFKTPTPRLKKPKSPSQYDNIVSPIGLYIHKSSAPVLMSNAKPKNINDNDLLNVERTSVQQIGAVGGCLPHRVYSKATKVDETTERDQVLPQNIRELFPSTRQVVIKHVGRFRSGTKPEQLDYSLNDSVMQLANSSAVANSPGLVDVSVHIARSGLQSPRVTPKKK